MRNYSTSVRALVTEAISEFILGLEWMKQNKCWWDFGTGRFEIAGRARTLKGKKSTNCVRKLFVSEDITIPAQQQTHVWCVTLTETLKEKRLWAVTPRAVHRDVLVASSIYDGEQVETAVRVLNLSETGRRFRKGECLALAEVVETISIPSPEEGPIDYSSVPATESQKMGESSVCNHMEEKEIDVSYLEYLVKNIGVRLSPEQNAEAVEFLKTNHDVFSKSNYDLGRSGLVKHTIDTGTNRPIKQPLRRQPIAYLPLIDANVEEMLQHDVIEPSTSPWASNVILVRKSDQTMRFCIDYRQVNNITSKDSYPLPRIDACFDALGGAKYLSTLDLSQGYWQVEIDKDSADKTSFVTRRGTFKFKVLSFGLSNAPAIFQRLMDLVLAGLTWEVCLVFLDDIIVMSKTFEEHLERLGLVFDRLRSSNLKLKPSKCFLVPGESQIPRKCCVCGWNRT